MNQNPYDAPRAYAGAAPAGPARTAFVLAAVGALLASAYWAAMTLLIGVGAAMGSGNVVQLFLPCFLVVLYALRGWQIFQGNLRATRRIVWLHGVGAIAASLQMSHATGLFFVLQSGKIVINVLGAAAAFWAVRASAPQKEK